MKRTHIPCAVSFNKKSQKTCEKELAVKEKKPLAAKAKKIQ